MERGHRPGFTESSGVYYFGIYVDPDPFRRISKLEVANRIGKSERNQIIVDQRKFDRKSRLLNRQISDVDRAIIRAQRQSRLEGVTLYIRDAVPNHSKGLIPEIIDCA